MTITFSSCFYIIKSKFEPEKYIEWMNNFISIVNNFYLVIYTDKHTIKYINTRNNEKIKIIIKPLEELYNYKYKDFWIENHKKNFLLNHKSCWELNMLWAEKINFVKETIERKHFKTEFYGWCDIGYFRNRKGQYNDTNINDLVDININDLVDTNINNLVNWPNTNKINKLDKNKIVYACINNNDTYINDIITSIKNKNQLDLPITPISPFQHSIAGGFFIIYKEKINWWFNLFGVTLERYLKNNYLIKDDQIILADCIFSNLDNFILFRECQYPFDNWFMFQRILN